MFFWTQKFLFIILGNERMIFNKKNIFNFPRLFMLIVFHMSKDCENFYKLLQKACNNWFFTYQLLVYESKWNNNAMKIFPQMKYSMTICNIDKNLIQFAVERKTITIFFIISNKLSRTHNMIFRNPAISQVDFSNFQ